MTQLSGQKRLGGVGPDTPMYKTMVDDCINVLDFNRGVFIESGKAVVKTVQFSFVGRVSTEKTASSM